jgi:RhtB (resistance to homoserine/threonine) family protein
MFAPTKQASFRLSFVNAGNKGWILAMSPTIESFQPKNRASPDGFQRGARRGFHFGGKGDAVIDVTPILKIAPIFAVALASPGPDFMLVSSLALSRGRLAGAQAACGIAVGILVYATLCMFGFGLMVAKMQGLMLAVKLCGGAYLIYLGYQMWKSSLRVARADASVAGGDKRRSPFVAGFLTTMTNPKTIAFFASIFALAMPPDASLSTKAATITVMGVLPVFWYSLVSYCLSTPSMRKVYMRWSRWIDRVAGTFLAFFGVRLLSSCKN